MADDAANLSRSGSLRASRRALAVWAPRVQLGLGAMGVGLFVAHIIPLVSGTAPLGWGERVVVGLFALVDLGGFALAAWIAGRLLAVAGDGIDVLIDQAKAIARAADLIEGRVVPALERVAIALEQRAAAPAPAATAIDGRASVAASVRLAIEEGRWDLAEKLIRDFARDYPEDPMGPVLIDEVTAGRQAVIDNLQARLDAAREANDPEAALSYRDELAQHLRGEPLKAIDKKLLRWLLGLLQKRMRTGTVRPDVAHLAARVAESFGDTPEGASVRASLPTLRRSAGLCPRCAQPYTGIEDACPRCLAARAGISFVPVPDEEPEPPTDVDAAPAPPSPP
ncbi:MAG: hypothetical protein IRY99_14785 [Isosphaeraceae bacterium]|nr:hypothetical protein [Isosphaeraceae bacterium]